MNVMLEVDEHHWWYRGRRRVLDAELAKFSFPRDTKILDAGCGSGRTLTQLATMGEVCGVELNTQAAAVARARGNFDVREGAVEAMPFPDSSFHLLTCLDVVEHTADDVASLRELRRVAKPGAVLLLTVPAYQFLWSAHDVSNHHYRRYNRRSLTAAALGAGWDVERMTHFNSLLLPPAAVVRILKHPGAGGADLRMPSPRVNRLLEQPLRAEAALLARGWSLPAGLSLLALLRNREPASGISRASEEPSRNESPRALSAT